MLIPYGTLQPAVGFVTIPLPTNNGYYLTLPTLLGSFLLELEARYGRRDLDYTILGIEFCGQIPMIWYPGSCKHVSVMLTDSASIEPRRAIFQLAHETVHLLSPSGGNHAPLIEEGLAFQYAEEISIRFQLGLTCEVQSYREAASKLGELLSIDPDAIKNIRIAEPQFSSWTPSLLQTVVPDLPTTLAQELCNPFNR